MINKSKLPFWLAIIGGTLLAPGVLSPAGRAAVITQTESLSEDTVWTADNTYLLEGRIFVEPGVSLRIEAGTVIKGKPGQQENASVLVVSPGARIFAEGTAAAPIIFTAAEDDLSDPYDLGPSDRGKWGGLILLGRARLNSPAASGMPITDNIEGIPVTDARGRFGGDDDEDSSGVLRYVSIRHGGTKIADNNEINGLTLGGVGRGTRIEYVEVFANLDDGIEFFGGTAEVKHAVVAYCGDDSYDYDQGYRGKGQFWFSIASDGDRGGEHDGDVDNFDSQPLSRPTIYNATYIGNGVQDGGQDALKLRENAGGLYANSIFTEFEDKALDISEDETEQMEERVASGDLEILGSLFWGFGSNKTHASTAPAQVFFTDEGRGNQYYEEDPQLLRRINREGSLEEGEQTDPRPREGSPALESRTAEPEDGFFHDVSFVGAFGEENWASGWTILSENGLLSNAGGGEPNYPLAGNNQAIPVVLSVSVVANGIEVSFMTVEGVAYQVQVSPDLVNWIDYSEPVAGNGGVVRVIFNLEELALVAPSARVAGFARVVSSRNP